MRRFPMILSLLSLVVMLLNGCATPKRATTLASINPKQTLTSGQILKLKPTSRFSFVYYKGTAIRVTVANGTLLGRDKNGRDRGQCGAFVNDYLGERRFGDSLWSKIDQINSDTPYPGAIAIIDSGHEWGHVGIIESVNLDGSVQMVESNINGDRRIHRHTHRHVKLDGNILGYYIPPEIVARLISSPIQTAHRQTPQEPAKRFAPPVAKMPK